MGRGRGRGRGGGRIRDWLLGDWALRISPAGRLEGASAALVAGVLVGLVACVLATWSGPFGATVGGADLYAMYLAKHEYIADLYLAGRLPLWNPYEFAGLPLHGTSQGSALYPPVVLPNLVLGRVAALQVAFWLHIVGFCVGMVWYLRDRGLGLLASCPAAFLGVVWFFESAGGAATNQAHYTFEYAYVPVIFLAWSRFSEGSRWAGLALPVLLCLQWLPGYPEFPMDTAALLGLVVLAGPGPLRVRRIGWVVALVALGALLAGIQLVPLAEATSESVRIAWANEDFEPIIARFAIDAANLDMRLLGLFGPAGLVLIATGAGVAATSRRAWCIAFCFAFFAATWPLSLIYEIYPYKLFRFAWGWLHLAPFFAACLVALAIDRIERASSPRLAPLAISFGVAGFAALYRDWSAAALAVGCALLLAPPWWRQRVGLATVVLAVVQAGVGFSDVTARRTQRAPDLERQSGRARQLHALRASLPNQPRVFGEIELRAGSFLADRLPSPLGHEAAVPPRRVFRLIRHIGMWNVFGHPMDPGALWRGMAENPGVMATLGLGILTGTPGEVRPLLAAGYRQVAHFEQGGVAVYRRPLPRLMIHHRVVTAADEDASFALVTAPGFDPFREVVIQTTGRIDAAPAVAGRREQVELRVDEPERLVARAMLSSPGVLLLRDAQYPGWSVSVDGRAAENVTANYAFRAVALAAGEHEVEWRYRSRSVLAGAIVSGVGIVLLVGLGVWLRRHEAMPRAPRAGAGPA